MTKKKTIKKCLIFTKADALPERKTNTWAVHNSKQIFLGRVQYCSKVKKYCFYPTKQKKDKIVYTSKQFTVLSEFLREQTNIHKSKK